MLHLWVNHLSCSLCFYELPRESLAYTRPVGLQPLLQPIFVRSTYTITGLHYSGKGYKQDLMEPEPIVELQAFNASY